MSNIVFGVPVKFLIGEKADISKYSGYTKSGYFTGDIESEFFKQMKVYAESDIFMQKHAIHFFKLDIEVDVPIGYIARVETSHDNMLGVSVCGDIICPGSHNRRIRGYIRNNNNFGVLIKKGDVIGELIVHELCERPISYNVTICACLQK